MSIAKTVKESRAALPAWVMPEWMEPYRSSFTNTGGDTIENLMNDNSSNSFNNVVRASLCISVESQVILLTRLKAKNLLK